MNESKDKQPSLAGLLKEHIPGNEGVPAETGKWDLGRLGPFLRNLK
ncbi:MAG: hypothetical protein M1390_01665 [Candidatus Marsarchaeota archaeon]|nr:hypothetical protein [Candidatus Marsarchaeota archaeon]